jgi:hypothetical protein
MTIKAVIRGGRIEPMEPLPLEWREGQELLVEQPDGSAGNVKVDQWVQDLDEATALVPAGEHQRFQQAMEEIERESKNRVRREWGLQ